MSKIKALVLTGYGLNCDHETAYVFERAGAVAERVHINALIDGSASLDDFQIMAFTGGFSWGDEHGAGVVQAVRMKTNIGEALVKFIEKGNLVIGICNGFQTLVNLGLLPGFDGDDTERSVALAANDCGNFRDQWVHLKIEGDSPCVFTQGIDRIELPVRHGEGKFIADSEVVARLAEKNRIVCRYATPEGAAANGAFPHNPNGSMDDIAGICDKTGRLFGLMPHPEGFNHATNHPDWTRRKAEAQRDGKPLDFEMTGLRIFENAVGYFGPSPTGRGRRSLT